MLYKFLEICELAVGDDEDASSERLMRTCRRRLSRTWGHMDVWMCGLHGCLLCFSDCRPGSGSLGMARGERFSNPTCYGYIHVLLIQANLTIICYIKYGGNAETCELAVGDNELGRGRRQDTRRRLLRTLGITWICGFHATTVFTHATTQQRRAGSSFPVARENRLVHFSCPPRPPR